jgi:transaldolase
MADPLGDLTRAGVAIWLDDLSRARLATGSLARLIRDWHVVGVTTNPTIVYHAISGSDRNDWQIRDLGVRGVGAAHALRALAVLDVSWACDLLRPIYDASQGVDGRVSIGRPRVWPMTWRRRSCRPADSGGW